MVPGVILDEGIIVLGELLFVDDDRRDLEEEGVNNTSTSLLLTFKSARCLLTSVIPPFTIETLMTRRRGSRVVHGKIELSNDREGK